MVLRIPLAATTLALPSPHAPTTRTSHAIMELISLAEQCEVLCPVTPTTSGTASRRPTKPTSLPTCRRSCRRESLDNSKVITPQHRARKAVIYLRQSTPQQALSHQESLRLHYALTERAYALGWPREAIEVIDAEVGRTAATPQDREGFHALVGQVTLGQVGIILSYDVTRLSRHCSDWYPLVALCGSQGCLMADGDGLDDPSTIHGRLLLGLQGTLSALALHTIRARMTAGLLHKAARGALALQRPTGLVRDAQGTVEKDPKREVQARLALVVPTCLQQRSASKVLQVCQAQGVP